MRHYEQYSTASCPLTGKKLFAKDGQVKAKDCIRSYVVDHYRYHYDDKKKIAARKEAQRKK